MANATLQLPYHQILAMASVRYEGGLTLQDTNYLYAPQNLPYAAAFGTMDIATVVPVRYGISLQTGIQNLFDRNYYYSPGYPEPGRTWYLNLRYKY